MTTSVVQRVADELDIMRLLARLAQAVDDRDAQVYRACFAELVICSPDDQSDGTPGRAISSEVYARNAINSVSHLDWIHHRLCNFVISIDDDRATAAVDVVVEMQSSNEAGVPSRQTIGGRYQLEFARLPIGWRITRRGRKTRYTFGDAALTDRSGRRAGGSDRSSES